MSASTRSADAFRPATTGVLCFRALARASQMHLFAAETVGMNFDELSIPAGLWHHFAVTRQEGVVTLFVNSLPVASGEVPHNLDSTSSLKFGHRGNFNDTPGSESDQEFYLNGLVDEVQVFVGRALPRGLIRAIYKAGNSGECKD